MKREKGWTLVELLVTLAVMGILATMIAPLIQSIGKSGFRQEVYVKMDNSLGKTMDIIKITMRNAQTVAINGNCYSMNDLQNRWTTAGAISTYAAATTIEKSNSKVLLSKVKITTTTGIGFLNNPDVTFGFGYDSETKVIYVDQVNTGAEEVGDYIGENITGAEFIYDPEMALLKVTLTMEVISGGIKYTREMSDVAKSRISIRR